MPRCHSWRRAPKIQSQSWTLGPPTTGSNQVRFLTFPPFSATIIEGKLVKNHKKQFSRNLIAKLKAPSKKIDFSTHTLIMHIDGHWTIDTPATCKNRENRENMGVHVRYHQIVGKRNLTLIENPAQPQQPLQHNKHKTSNQKPPHLEAKSKIRSTPRETKSANTKGGEKILVREKERIPKWTEARPEQ